MNWSDYANFSEAEFACGCGMCGGEADMNADHVARLQRLRDILDRRVIVLSGYRCAWHPAEKSKARPGSHAAGLATDIAASTAADKFSIVRAAYNVGFVGIGVSQSFVHVDSGHPAQGVTRPAMWIYS